MGMSDPVSDPMSESSLGTIDSESSEEEVDILRANSQEKEEAIDGSHSKTSNKKSKKGRKRVIKKYVKKEIICSQCKPNRYFKKQKVLDLHKNVIHSLTPEKVCLWCAKHFFTDHQLLVHQELYDHNKTIDFPNDCPTDRPTDRPTDCPID